MVAVLWDTHNSHHSGNLRCSRSALLRGARSGLVVLPFAKRNRLLLVEAKGGQVADVGQVASGKPLV